MRCARQLQRATAAVFAAMLALSIPSLGAAPNGERALMDGRVDEAIALLNAVTAANPRDAAAHLLLCRAYYSEEAADEAVKECEAAMANGAGASSEAHDWMGRAYGAKADHAGPFGGFSLAKKVRAEFERAVQLDPANAAAVNDLSEFYVNAPPIVGGGTDKALALADKVQGTLPWSAHRMRGLVATKNKDYATAERELKAAVAAASRPAEAWVDLAAFYAKRKQADDATAALRKAEEADKNKGGVLLDVASLRYELNRETPEAIRAVRAYLGSSAKTDAAPVCKAHVVLGNLLARSGDKAGARHEYQAALALASKYAPARKAMDSL